MTPEQAYARLAALTFPYAWVLTEEREDVVQAVVAARYPAPRPAPVLREPTWGWNLLPPS